MWHQLLPLYNLVYNCRKILVIVLIVNSVVSKLKRFVMIELVIMNVILFLGIKQKYLL